MVLRVVRSALVYLFGAFMPLWVATSTPALGQNVGLGLFALLSPKFPCTTALSAFNNSAAPTLAVLWGTFGEDTQCLAMWFDQLKGRPHLLEIHLSNEACRRNNRCYESDFLPRLSVSQLNKRLESGDDEIISRYTTRIIAIREAIAPFIRGNGEYLLSTGLEDNFSEGAYRKVLALVQENWPHKTVRSPVGDPSRRRSDSATYMEGHGATPQFKDNVQCIVNLDGDDMHFPHRAAVTRRSVSWEGSQQFVARYQQKCRATFLWAAPWQGIIGDTFIPPLDRELIVSREDVAAVQRLLP